jgi:GNAT superfamily N-acetyltransferase
MDPGNLSIDSALSTIVSYGKLTSSGRLQPSMLQFASARPRTSTARRQQARNRESRLIFATHPDWTKPGIGRAIYRSYENAARSKGVISFECYFSLKAEAFYAALVFKSIEAISIDLGPNIV